VANKSLFNFSMTKFKRERELHSEQTCTIKTPENFLYLQFPRLIDCSFSPMVQVFSVIRNLGKGFPAGSSDPFVFPRTPECGRLRQKLRYSSSVGF